MPKRKPAYHLSHRTAHVLLRLMTSLEERGSWTRVAAVVAAAQEAARALRLEPSLTLPRALQELGDLLSGKPERGATLSLGPNVGVRAMCLYSLGRIQEAARIADSLHAAFAVGAMPDSTFSAVLAARGLAEYYAWTGDAQQALTWLERAYTISPEGDSFGVFPSGIYDRVREDPRFKAGFERIRTPSL